MSAFFVDGFITYDSQIPKQLLDSGGPRTKQMDINNTVGHFELLNYQLKEVSCAGYSCNSSTCVLGLCSLAMIIQQFLVNKQSAEQCTI